MPAEPQIVRLSYRHRVIFFWFLTLIFVITIPIIIFYTTGYRIAFTDDEAEIVTTGGLYISSEYADTSIYVDDTEVDGRQFLGEARYIQNIDAGLHQIVVQGDGVETWVKELPVFEYRVTEAAAFTRPLTPRARILTPYVTATSTSVVRATSSPVFRVATHTTPYIVSTTTATSSLVANEEYEFVTSLFASSSTTTTSVFTRMRDQLERFTFSSEVASTTRASSTFGTTTVRAGDIELYEDGEEVHARWIPESFADARHYFCVEYESASTTRAWYGAHVQADIKAEYGTTTDELSGRVCRRDIRIDRKGQDVFWFDFYPNRNDFVLLHLSQGLYMTEIDDRSWQNVQQLYPGEDIRVALDGNQIFIDDGGQIFELLPNLEE